MLYRIAADLLVVLHLFFILFVMAGGFAVLHDRRWMFVHLPAAVWGALIELNGWICPLTPLENRLRFLGGEQPYTDDFITHYLLPIIYPPGLTPETQYVLAVLVLAVNTIIYGYYWYRGRKPLVR